MHNSQPRQGKGPGNEVGIIPRASPRKPHHSAHIASTELGLRTSNGSFLLDTCPLKFSRTFLHHDFTSRLNYPGLFRSSMSIVLRTFLPVNSCKITDFLVLASTIPMSLYGFVTRTENHQIHEFNWLKSILKTVKIFLFRPASRPVMFCRRGRMKDFASFDFTRWRLFWEHAANFGVFLSSIFFENKRLSEVSTLVVKKVQTKCNHWLYSSNNVYHSMHFFFFSVGREPTMWSAKNCLQIIVCSYVVSSKRVLLQTLFWSCVVGTTFSKEKSQVASLSCQKWLKCENKLGDRILKQCEKYRYYLP